MCTVLPMGAYKHGTKEYVYPAIANKIEKYTCPECLKNVILRKGNIRMPHFAHFKDENPCNYYIKPSESQIHKDAKLLMKNILENKKQLSFIRKCPNNCCIEPEEYEIPEIGEQSEIVLEHRFYYNGTKIADVAYLDNNSIVCLFEIYNTHRTENANRPEPWFEVDAKELIHCANIYNGKIKISCVRKNICENCKLIKCQRCNNLCPKRLMETNTNDKLCKSCDIECWNAVYLHVPFSEKEQIKTFGGRFDPFYKKWYITNDNVKKDIILLKWKFVSL